MQILDEQVWGGGSLRCCISDDSQEVGGGPCYWSGDHTLSGRGLKCFLRRALPGSRLPTPQPGSGSPLQALSTDCLLAEPLSQRECPHHVRPTELQESCFLRSSYCQQISIKVLLCARHGEAAVNKTDKIPVLIGLTFECGEMDSKQIRKILQATGAMNTLLQGYG